MLVHGGIWGPIGAAGGLAFALGLGGGPRSAFRATLGGLVGASLGTVLFEIVGAWFFPLAKTAYPIAVGAGARLTARLLTSPCSRPWGPQERPSPGIVLPESHDGSSVRRPRVARPRGIATARPGVVVPRSHGPGPGLALFALHPDAGGSVIVAVAGSAVSVEAIA